jgi:glucose-6-phosphate 1-dehydrogenase
MRFLLIFLLSSSCLLAETVLVIFGATGDLTSRKILPAIDGLQEAGAFSEPFALVGMARRPEEEFRKQVTHPILYAEGDFDEDIGYERLGAILDAIDEKWGKKSNRIYFLATQPKYFSTIVEKLDQHELIYAADDSQWSRVLIEKPFGHDLNSALELKNEITKHLDASQIYLIDHYLGKEGVQNLVGFRVNGDFDSIWNHQFIEKVEITLSEEIGVGTRGKFWEETGMLRDVVQNHVMQLLSLIAMEVGPDIPAEKTKAVEAIRIDTIQRGQYGPGEIQGSPVLGYREEVGVPKDSNVETLVEAKLFVENERWKGVPFHIQAGKRLAKQLTEIVVTFKSGEILHMRIQPKPAIYFEGKPEMDFAAPQFSEGYQKLIYDAISGNQTSFVQNEEQIASWKLLTPILESWKEEQEISIYPAGTMKWIHDFQLFLFDFDGLLVNTEHLHYQAYVNMLAKRGYTLQLSFANFLELAHFNSTAWREALYAEIPALEPNWEILYREKKEAFLNLLVTGKVELMPGAETLLKALDEAKIRRCVVTNSILDHIKLIRARLPVLDTIEKWITREDYEKPKPSPECYLKAIQLYGKPGDRIIGFEDSVRGHKALCGTPAFPVLICPKHYPLLEVALQQGGGHFESLEEVSF